MDLGTSDVPKTGASARGGGAGGARIDWVGVHRAFRVSSLQCSQADVRLLTGVRRRDEKNKPRNIARKLRAWSIGLGGSRMAGALSSRASRPVRRTIFRQT